MIEIEDDGFITVYCTGVVTAYSLEMERIARIKEVTTVKPELIFTVVTQRMAEMLPLENSCYV